MSDFFVEKSIKSITQVKPKIYVEVDLDLGRSDLGLSLDLKLGGQISKLLNLFRNILRWFIRSGIKGHFLSF